MKDKDEKKPLGGTAGAAKPEQDASKPETPGAADKAAEDPGAGKEEKKKLDAPAAGKSADAAQVDEKDTDGKMTGDGAKDAAAGAQNGAEVADVDSGKTAGKSEADAGSAAEPGAAFTSAEGDAEPEVAAADAGGGDPEKEALRRELLVARSQLVAYCAGVAPEMIADAVTLATAEAQAAGDVSAESIAKAMDGVLKRHPEWKAGGEGSVGAKKVVGASNRAGGFKLGVDPGGVSSAGGEGSEAKSPKRWNRFK